MDSAPSEWVGTTWLYPKLPISLRIFTFWGCGQQGQGFAHGGRKIPFPPPPWTRLPPRLSQTDQISGVTWDLTGDTERPTAAGWGPNNDI